MYRTLVPLLLLFVVGCDGSSGGSSAGILSEEPAPVETPPLSAAPDNPPASTSVQPSAANEVSISETSVQTEVDTAPASQTAQSDNFVTTSVVEAVQPEPAVSETFSAISSVQIIHRGS